MAEPLEAALQALFLKLRYHKAKAPKCLDLLAGVEGLRARRGLAKGIVHLNLIWRNRLRECDREKGPKASQGHVADGGRAGQEPRRFGKG